MFWFFSVLCWLLKKKVEINWKSSELVILRSFWMDQGKGPFVDLYKVKKYNKLLTRSRLWTWNTQEEVSIEITSTYEDLRRIWWAIAQGNISFFVSYYVWTNFTSQLYFWLRFIRIFFTLYGFYVYPVYFVCFWLGNRACSSFPIKCVWNCYKIQI